MYLKKNVFNYIQGGNMRSFRINDAAHIPPKYANSRSKCFRPSQLSILLPHVMRGHSKPVT